MLERTLLSNAKPLKTMDLDIKTLIGELQTILNY